MCSKLVFVRVRSGPCSSLLSAQPSKRGVQWVGGEELQPSIQIVLRLEGGIKVQLANFQIPTRQGSFEALNCQTVDGIQYKTLYLHPQTDVYVTCTC